MIARLFNHKSIITALIDATIGGFKTTHVYILFIIFDVMISRSGLQPIVNE